MRGTMSERGADFVERWKAETARLYRDGLYDPAEERDACGVGLVVAIDGKPRREVVELGIAALKAVWHRGAVDADGKTGDGAGIHVQIPQNFFREHIRKSGHEPIPGKLGVGMVFLPRTDLEAQERCRIIVESEILKAGFEIYGWRQVPVNVEVIGEKANATRPESAVMKPLMRLLSVGNANWLTTWCACGKWCSPKHRGCYVTAPMPSARCPVSMTCRCWG